jgi:aryl-alcohol dehydrogenase-like predicted oxidoreductase
MDYRRLGQSTLTVSAVGLGGNNFGDRLDLAATRQVVHAALEGGITLIDTADTYNAGASEQFSARGARTWCWRPSSAFRCRSAAGSRVRPAVTS